MSNIDEQFVEYIVKSLVGNPDGVAIDRTIDEKGVLLKLTVDQEDLGRVIGKRGATAQSIRTLLRALGTKNDARYNLKIVDTGEGERPAKPAPPSEEKTSKEDESEEEPVEAEEQPAEADEEKPSDETEKATVDEETDVDDVDSQPQEPVEEPQETLAERTRKELDDLDDLEI